MPDQPLLISTAHALVKGKHAPPCTQAHGWGAWATMHIHYQAGYQASGPWLGVRSAGPRPMTFDPGSYDVTARCYVMIK